MASSQTGAMPETTGGTKAGEETGAGHEASSSSSSPSTSAGKNNVIVKVGLIGDAQCGKTSLMVRYVEGSFNEVSRRLHLSDLRATHTTLAGTIIDVGLYPDARSQLYGKDNFDSQH